VSRRKFIKGTLEPDRRIKAVLEKEAVYQLLDEGEK